MRLLFFTIVIIAAVASCPDLETPSETPQSEMSLIREKFHQRVYFKSDVRDRIFVYQAKSVVTADQAKKLAQMQMHTSGQMTAVYIYQPNQIAPGNILNTERSIFRVNDLLYNSTDINSWRFAYFKNRDDSVNFVDCETEQDRTFCR